MKEGVLLSSAVCCSLFSFASDGSHYWAFKACFMSVGVRCPFLPLLCLVVGGGVVVEGLVCLPACVCVFLDGRGDWSSALENRGAEFNLSPPPLPPSPPDPQTDTKVLPVCIKQRHILDQVETVKPKIS